MKRVFAAALLYATAASGTAFAACSYNGVYYDHGAVLCFDGYLQECTVADYWKAIGTCNAPDPRPQRAERSLDERALDERALVAMAREELRPAAAGPAHR